MKNFVIAAAIALCVGSNQIDVLPHSDRLAVAGCCKKRVQDRWTYVGRDFANCLRENAIHDRDDIYSQTGSYWWDLRC